MNAQYLSANLLPEAWRCYGLGELARAEALCRQVLSAQPDLPEALHLLGVIAYRAGQLDLAIAWSLRAVQADPTNADYHNDLGVICTCAGQLAEAAAAFERTLRLRPDYAKAYNNLGFALLKLGRHEEARASSEQALRLWPDFAEACNNLGLTLLELGRLQEAAEQFQKAVRLQPDLAEAHRNLGIALAEQGQMAEALASYEQALLLRPGDADVHIHLNDMLKRQGRFAEALAHLQEALRIKPDHAFAFWNLGQFATQGMYRFADQDLRRAKALVASERVPLIQRSLLHLTLGDVLDHDGAYDAAFDHYRHGNALRKEQLRQTGRAFDPAAHKLFIDTLIADFDEDCLQGGQAGCDSELPVFVIGMPRSGTTLVQQIVASHSKVVGAGELEDLARLVTGQAPSNEAISGSLASFQFADKTRLAEVADRYLAKLKQIGPQAARVIDKMPDNFLLLGVIASLFPKARIIHCRRDALDTCLSCYFQNFSSVPYAWSLEDLGQYYRDYERLMAHWNRVLPLRMMEVRYEDLVAHQESVSRKVVAFCGLEWEEGCLKYYKNPQPVKTVTAVQVRRPIYNSSVGRWKHYAAHLEPLRRALGMSCSAPRLTEPCPAHFELVAERCK